MKHFKRTMLNDVTTKVSTLNDMSTDASTFESLDDFRLIFYPVDRYLNFISDSDRGYSFTLDEFDTLQCVVCHKPLGRSLDIKDFALYSMFVKNRKNEALHYYCEYRDNHYFNEPKKTLPLNSYDLATLNSHVWKQKNIERPYGRVTIHNVAEFGSQDKSEKIAVEFGERSWWAELKALFESYPSRSILIRHYAMNVSEIFFALIVYWDVVHEEEDVHQITVPLIKQFEKLSINRENSPYTTGDGVLWKWTFELLVDCVQTSRDTEKADETVAWAKSFVENFYSEIRATDWKRVISSLLTLRKQLRTLPKITVNESNVLPEMDEMKQIESSPFDSKDYELQMFMHDIASAPKKVGNPL